MFFSLLSYYNSEFTKCLKLRHKCPRLRHYPSWGTSWGTSASSWGTTLVNLKCQVQIFGNFYRCLGNLVLEKRGSGLFWSHLCIHHWNRTPAPGTPLCLPEWWFLPGSKYFHFIEVPWSRTSCCCFYFYFYYIEGGGMPPDHLVDVSSAVSHI